MQENNHIEEQLWRKLKSGDVEAWSKLYQSYADELFDYGSKLTPDSDCVLDSIHDLFLDVFKYRKKLVNPDSIKYYLLRSLRRKVLKRLKAARLNQQHQGDFQENIEDSVEQRIIKSENEVILNYKLRHAVGMLNDKQAEILSMRFTENRSYQEIANHNGVTIETVRTSIYRTVKKLRQILMD